MGVWLQDLARRLFLAHLAQEGRVVADQVEEPAVQDAQQPLLGRAATLATEQHIDALHVCGAQQLLHEQGTNVAGGTAHTPQADSTGPQQQRVKECELKRG